MVWIGEKGPRKCEPVSVSDVVHVCCYVHVCVCCIDVLVYVCLPSTVPCMLKV